jgi:CHAT domain-containing protein/Tfp pilus assembly protein PilF
MLSSIHAQLRVVLSWSCLLLLVCSSVTHIASAQSADDDAALRKLVEKFFDLYQKTDLEGVMTLWSEKSPDFVTSKQEFRQTFAANKIQLRSLTIRKIDVNKDKATVRAVAEIRAEDVKTGKAAAGFGIMNRTFHLLKEGEVWKVWQYVISEQELAAALVLAKADEDRKALLAAEKELVTVELVRALQSEGVRLRTQGAHSVALDSFRLTLSLAAQLHDRIGAANALRGIGIVHTSQGDYTQALEHFRESLKISGEIGDKRGIAGALGNIGIVHASQGDYTQALEHYQRALKIIQEIGDKRGIAISLGNIGLVHYARGNYTQALKHHHKSLTINEEIGDKQAIASVLGNIGLVHYAQGNYTLALGHYQRSLKISGEIGDKKVIANILANIGLVYASQDNYTQALEHYRESLKISGEIGDKKGMANTRRNIGFVHYSQGNYAQALKHYRESLKISGEIGDKKVIAYTQSNIGLVYASQGDYTQALEHYRESLKIRQEIGDEEGVAEAFSGIGSVHYSQGDYTQARQELANAIVAVEELRGRVVGNEQQQQQFFQLKLSPYRQMIGLLMDEKNGVEAFGYAERVKGRALLDTLETGRVELTKAMTDSEQAEERSLNAEVVSLNTRIYREKLRKQPDKAVLSDLEARREKARASYEAFQISLYAAHPELMIQRGQMKPVSISEAGKLIPNLGAAVVEYVVTEDKTYLFVLTKGQQSRAGRETSAEVPVLNVYTINIKQKDLAERVGRFHGRVTQKDFDFSKPSRELYNLLIGPARADLKTKTSLIVVPDGVLWQVPFQTLQPSANHFLIQDYAISYAPSLTVLREMMNVKQKRQPYSGALSTLVAFGNPDLDPTTAANRQAVYTEVLADEKLLPLPQTEHLVKILSRLYGPDRSKIYVRAEAREDRAKREAGTCRILQFATHGILDNTNPMYSRLVMSQSGVDEHEDGMLEAWEIMKLDLNAEMVILSACDTARGPVAGGEGMIGLAWAFFVAGCPTTVVSQWTVEVNSTTELMVEFHNRLKAGFEGRNSDVSKAEALRAAVLKLMRNPHYRHPFYWAPFVVIGDAR